MRRLLTQAGLIDVRAVPQVMTIADVATLETTLRLFSMAGAGVASGAFSQDEASTWEADLRAKDGDGDFSCYAVMFIAFGLVPDRPGNLHCNPETTLVASGGK